MVVFFGDGSWIFSASEVALLEELLRLREVPPSSDDSNMFVTPRRRVILSETESSCQEAAEETFSSQSKSESESSRSSWLVHDVTSEEEYSEPDSFDIAPDRLDIHLRKVDQISQGREWYAKFNQDVFGNQLPLDIRLEWKPRLLTTAGRARFRSKADGTRSATIELSVKVLDNREKLRKTLLHEMCHVAQWLLDGEMRPPHGDAFQRWASIASRTFPHYRVTTTHNYAIHKPHRWQCLTCGQLVSRHSKSFKNEEFQCGAHGCGGVFEYLGRFNKAGDICTPRAVTPYQQFVRDNYGRVRNRTPRAKEAMQEIGAMWRNKQTDDSYLEEKKASVL
ncbi:MAG: hypothetical protein KVP17_000392 [Porospora cf. gigantea B]|uniref:uncharacterized protein n=1 Tax=Porospora cf. gigantea B TaxID=2853592 RepID=UPI003571EA15|nr:MAG: hypothetical protein KVP17_000392 [Porospora cf. gigantea B]